MTSKVTENSFAFTKEEKNNSLKLPETASIQGFLMKRVSL